jgi:predicted ATPase with chaperone activity
VNSGRHHILLEGAPGVGKSAWCTAIKDIQSPLLSDEIIEKFKISPHETSKLRSLEDLLQAPYEAPHHSSSMASIVGGGSQNIHIGYITRAHRGILFLDELAEFPKNVIEALREPLESKSITLGRSGYSKSFPADIQLIAAMNPCPCGNHLSKKQCYCGTKKFHDYQAKISTPMRERFHLNLYWNYENFEQPPEFQLKKIRQKIIELRTVPIPQMSGIKVPRDLNPRRQRKWTELFRTWCHWHAISTPSPKNQHDFQEFISELQIQNTKEAYEQFRYN